MNILFQVTYIFLYIFTNSYIIQLDNIAVKKLHLINDLYIKNTLSFQYLILSKIMCYRFFILMLIVLFVFLFALTIPQDTSTFPSFHQAFAKVHPFPW